MRLIDVVICFVLVVFLVISLTIDIFSAISPLGRNGVPGVRLETTIGLWWPPKFFRDYVLWWCDGYDPAFCYNPPWMRFLAFLSPFLYAPFYITALYCIIRRKNWIRVPILMWAYGLLITLTLIMFEEWVGENRAKNYPIVFLANFPYWSFPFLIFWRFGPDNPFPVGAKPKRGVQSEQTSIKKKE